MKGGEKGFQSQGISNSLAMLGGLQSRVETFMKDFGNHQGSPLPGCMQLLNSPMHADIAVDLKRRKSKEMKTCYLKSL